MTLALAILLPVVAALVAGAVTPWVLRVLPEPDLDPDEHKVPYRDLPARALALGAAGWAGGLTVATTATLPPAAWAPYVVVATVGSVGCSIDIATTFLPRRILHVGWVLLPVVILVTTLTTGGGWVPLVRAAAGAAIVFALLLVAYVTGGFGYSDVRLGLLTGAVSAWTSWQHLVGGLVYGSVVGALWGLAHATRNGVRSAFAYGPAILVGPYLALLVPAVAPW